MPRKLLIVEDNPDALWTYETILTATLPHIIMSAANGRDAIRIVKDERPDVILLDVNMPLMDGFQVMEALQAEEEFRTTRVIFLTGDANRLEDKLKGFALGAFDYLIKPVDENELIARVDVAFRFKEMEESLLAERETIARLEGILQTVRTLQHEVNNPLQALLGTLELIERSGHGGPDERLGERLERLREAAERIARVIERVGRVTQPEVVSGPVGDMLRLPDSPPSVG